MTTKVTSMMSEAGTKGADIASATTIVIGTDGSYFDITGSTGITTQMTVDAGRTFTLQFDGAVTITDNAAMTLAGAANFTTEAGDILTFLAVAANTVVQIGNSLVDGGSPVAPAGGGFTLGTLNNTTSVTANEFTGIPADTHMIVMSFNSISTNGTSDILIQLGDSGGYETSSHVGTCCNGAGTDTNYASSGNGFRMVVPAVAATLYHGHAWLIEQIGAAGGTQWTFSYQLAAVGTIDVWTGCGSKSTSAELDRLRITTTGGTDTFDVFNMNISYQ